MPDDKSRDETVHIRCTTETKLLAKSAAALRDADMSEWLRETIRDSATDDLPEDMVAEIERRAADGDDMIDPDEIDSNTAN